MPCARTTIVVVAIIDQRQSIAAIASTLGSTTRWAGNVVREPPQLDQAVGDIGHQPADYAGTQIRQALSPFVFIDLDQGLAFRACQGVELVQVYRLGQSSAGTPGMCNLYNVTTNQEAIRAFTRAMVDNLGNLEPSLDVYPDRMAPIVHNTPAGRELASVRWGLPSSRQALFQAASKRADKLREKGKDVDFDELLKMEPDGGTTNVRNTASKHWTRWLGVEHRCLVPVTRFAEPDPASKVEGGRTPNAWFARNEDQPLMCFAGIWVPQWESVRKVKEGLVKADLFAFLTCEPNAVVAPIHPKAMPVLLTEPEEVETWMTAPWNEARALQRPLPDDRLVLLPTAAD